MASPELRESQFKLELGPTPEAWKHKDKPRGAIPPSELARQWVAQGGCKVGLDSGFWGLPSVLVL